MGNREIKTSYKTKEEIVDRLSLRVLPHHAHTLGPVLEVEKHLADSGAQSGSVSNSWLVVLLMGNYHIFPSRRVMARAYYISSCFRHSSCRINSTADKRGTFILDLILLPPPPPPPTKYGWSFFKNVVKVERKSRQSSRFVADFCYFMPNSCCIRRILN